MWYFGGDCGLGCVVEFGANFGGDLGLDSVIKLVSHLGLDCVIKIYENRSFQRGHKSG